ncbi:MAG TPA: YIP1 family protein [Bacteroidota bacterium]|nr:YIP1 family protein [Bacteroidota bacterium]
MQDTSTTQPTGEPQVAPMSFTEKLTNIFAAPGELYDNVRATPPTSSNWIVPMILFIIITFAMSQLTMRNPSLGSQLKDQIAQQSEKRFQEAIQKGQMTAEQADQAREQTEKFTDPTSPWMMMITGGSLLIMTPIATFLICLVYWLLGRTVMKVAAPYMKVVEVIGLTFFIACLESIVTTIMAIAFDKLHAGPNLALAVINNFSIENKVHLALQKINLFTFWNLGVVGIGLSRLFQKDLPKVLVLVVALWVLWAVFSVATGFGAGT